VPTSNGAKGYVQQLGIERLIGGEKGDQLTGNDGNNVISGKGGHDRIFGGDGADKLIGQGARTSSMARTAMTR
jgi:Ca2+-binding RTX toxin-like protein